MKRADQILKLLLEPGTVMTEKAIAEACETLPQNINASLGQLVKDGLLTRAKHSDGWRYQITEAGTDRTNEADFGQESRRGGARTPAAAGCTPLAIGIFTTGELHIEANGKKLVLSKPQATELVEFVCALPNRLFADASTSRPAASGIASFVHRMKDD